MFAAGQAKVEVRQRARIDSQDKSFPTYNSLGSGFRGIVTGSAPFICRVWQFPKLTEAGLLQPALRLRLISQGGRT
jgi:hypothetical protein